MAEKSGELGGYKLDFVKDPDPRLKCPMCKLALRSPFQTICGHRYCESCIKNVINNGNKKCPEDGTVLSLEQIFRDAFCNREMLDLECLCTNKNLGCKWTGPLKTLQDHLKDDCLFLEVTCPNDGCNKKMPKGALEKHVKEECQFKKILCKYCGEEQPQPRMKEHWNTTCAEFPLDCQKGCGQKVPRSQMENHLARDCPKAESACPMTGQCDFQGSRADLKKHILEKPVEHTTMMTDRISSMETNVQRIDDATKTIEQRQQALDNQVNNYREELTTFRDDLAALRVAVDQRQNATHEIEERAQPGREPQGAEAPRLRSNADGIQDLKTRLERLEDQLKQIQLRERQALGRGQTGDNDNANETVPDLERRVAAMEHQDTLTDVQIADHDVKINMLERTSYDGTFFWKIEDFGRLLQDAISGRCLSIYSPQFYVCRYGYKVCTRVYLNGDGMGKGTHLSLFFVVMRGNYDALLNWPFQQKVTFKLIDQGGDQHIIDSFRPDPNSSSFQRPASNMNIASGCPLFVPKSVLHSRGYIKDDTVFFKITVDTAGLPIY